MIASRRVNMQECQSPVLLTRVGHHAGMVILKKMGHTHGPGQHAGMVGQHKQE
jgi:hypothetical protein